MPQLTPEQKNQILGGRGLNPGEWDITDDLKVIPKDKTTLAQPSVSSPQILSIENNSKLPTTPPGSDDSSLMTGLKSAASSVLPTLAGGAGAGVAAAFAPETMGLSFILPIAAAYLSSKLTDKAQSAVMPDSWQQNLQASEEENPKSALLGRLATMPLGGFNPSPVNAIKAVGNTGRTILGDTLNAAQKANIANVGIGAGLGAGTSVVDSLHSGQSVDIGDILKNAAVGGLFNKPNAIGRNLFGFHDNVPQGIHEQLAGQLPMVDTSGQQSQQSTVPNGIDLEAMLSAAGAPETRGDIQPGSLKGAAGRSDKLAKFKETPEVQPKDLQTLEGEGGPVRDTQDQQSNTTLDDLNNLLLSIKKLPISEQEKTQAFTDLLEKSYIPGAKAKKQLPPDFKSQFDFIDANTKDAIQQHLDDLQAAKDQLMGKLGSKSFTPSTKSVAPIEQPSGGNIKYQQYESALKTKNQQEVLTAAGTKKPSPTDEWFDILGKHITGKGIKTDINGNPTDAAGNAVTGATMFDAANIPTSISINKQRAGADTLPHEWYHGFISALRNSSRARDQRIVKEYDNLVQSSEDYKSWKANREAAGLVSTPEEYQATNAGYEFVKRHLNQRGETPLKSWANDFKTYLKTRFTKHGTVDDYQRLLDYRMSNEDKSIGSYFGDKVNTPVGGVNPAKMQQEESDLTGEHSPVKNLKTHFQFDEKTYKKALDTWYSEKGNDLEKQMENLNKYWSAKGYHIGGPFDKWDIATKEGHSINKNNLDSLSEEGTITPQEHQDAKNYLLSKEKIFKEHQLPVNKLMIDDKDFYEEPKSLSIKNKLTDVEYQKQLQEKIDYADALERQKFHDKDALSKAPKEIQDMMQMSKVREPQYHMTDRVYDRNDPEWAAEHGGRSVFGTHVGTAKAAGEVFKSEHSVKPLQETKYWTDLRNPYKVDDNEANFPRTLARRMMDDKLMTESEYKMLPLSNKESASILKDILKRAGYDGLEYKNSVEDKGSTSYVVFHKDQLVNALAHQGGIQEQRRDPESNRLYQQEKSYLPGIIRPEIDKIRSLDHPDADKVADAFTGAYMDFRAYKGKFVNDIAGKLLSRISWKTPQQVVTQDTLEFRRVWKYMNDMSDSGSSPIHLTASEKSIEKDVRDNLLSTLAEKNKFSTLRKTEEADPNYIPQIPSRQTLETLLNKPGSQEATKLWKDWEDYYTNILGKSQKEADEAQEIFKKGYLKQEIALAKKFGPIDEAAGLGIPPSFREKNLVDLMTRFNTRYARRLAYHKNIEANPEVMTALNDPKTGLAASEVVKNVNNDINGVTEHQEANRAALSGVVRAGMLGPLTGAKDFVSNLTLGFQHMEPLQVVQSALKSWSSMKQNLADSYATGVNRHNIGSIEFGEGGTSDFSNILRRSRDIINEVQGRNFFEKMARATAFGQGKFVAMDNLLAAKKGNISKQQSKFFDNFAPKDWAQYKQTGEFPVEVLNEIAAKYVESVQGTYDYRGLPSIAQKGTLAPYLSLARWNIEKLNNFDKHVVRPAMNGNYMPLLMSTVGMLIGGEAVNQVVKLVTNRKEKTPTYSEIAAFGEEGSNTLLPITYKLAGLASLSGYMGIAGDLTKSIMDLQFKNKPQLYNNPLISGLETAGQNVVDVVDALNNGNLDITGDVISQFLEDTIQAYRLGLAHLSPEKQKDIDKGNMSRDLRMFNITHGVDVGNITSERANPFLNKDEKEFKKTSDVGEATTLLPGLIQKAFEKYNKSGGNIDTLKNEFQKLKENNYQTMPSFDRMPQSFFRYLSFLSKTQGPEEASKRMNDYISKNMINKVKSEMVPSF